MAHLAPLVLMELSARKARWARLALPEPMVPMVLPVLKAFRVNPGRKDLPEQIQPSQGRKVSRASRVHPALLVLT